MKLRRAATLVVAFEGARYRVHNFLTKQKFFCSQEGLEFLGTLEDWQTPKQVMRAHQKVDPASLGDQVARLVEYGAVMVHGTPEAEKDKIYREGWRWG